MEKLSHSKKLAMLKNSVEAQIQKSGLAFLSCFHCQQALSAPRKKLQQLNENVSFQ